jgi:hypothetical protein
MFRAWDGYPPARDGKILGSTKTTADLFDLHRGFLICHNIRTFPVVPPTKTTPKDYQLPEQVG